MIKNIFNSESDSSSTSIIQRSAANNVDDTDNESEDIVKPRNCPKIKFFDFSDISGCFKFSSIISKKPKE
ncbi:hypothetical protein BpHYR1_033261 [Brachionus plicatilis]|uniref:Uncharacterized protein n=1 Tax=Brachionus plicatilis TaxID=10195 RepID=A0A3M7T732_BRAPC|nr:hypothetical protein BpHYR1_033261 [Brachionus plicatilis]